MLDGADSPEGMMVVLLTANIRIDLELYQLSADGVDLHTSDYASQLAAKKQEVIQVVLELRDQMQTSIKLNKIVDDNSTIH
jgi:hypothetical protein